jgi:Fungal specific transcription factor domain
VKCDRAQPCRCCSKSGSLCHYPDPRDANNSFTFAEDVLTQRLDAHGDSVLGQTAPATDLGIVLPSLPALSSIGEETENIGLGTREQASHTQTEPLTNLNPTSIEHHGISPWSFSAAFADQSPDELSLHGIAVGLGLDWLDFELYDPGEPLTNGTAFLNSGFATQVQLFSNHDTAPTNAPDLDPAHLQIPVQQWPFDQIRDSMPHKLRLPPLREVLRGIVGSSEHQTQSLAKLMSLPYLPRPHESQEPETFAAMQLLERALDRYFSDFHSILPLIHVPSWDMYKAPTVLLAAMASIGSMTVDERDFRQLSWCFSEICLQMIIWLVSDLTALWPKLLRVGT